MHISIHAPHEGERLGFNYALTSPRKFQSTLPTRGSDAEPYGVSGPTLQFQSTLPTRGSDQLQISARRLHSYFNPRSPRGGATEYRVKYFGEAEISIHAPHEGERLDTSTATPLRRDFNPRSPRGGATFICDKVVNRLVISIHAPHEGERHNGVALLYSGGAYFNPRSPRGGATQDAEAAEAKVYISIHAPHEGERRASGLTSIIRIIISIHAPHEGERPKPKMISCGIWHFNPRSPRGGATWSGAGGKQIQPYFNPRSPRGGATRGKRVNGQI